MKAYIMPATVIAMAMYFASAAYAQAPFDSQDGILVNESGMTLYTYDKDKAGSGESSCYDQCAQNWPPAEAPADASASGDYTIIERKDGTKQWAWQGQPLYTFVKDQNPGDRSGDNVGGVWHIVEE